MKVFISWSGDRGKAFAKILHGWLPDVLQEVKPFFSSDDVAKGVRWESEVSSELNASQIGIIVVTRDSLSAPWIMFEAGALTKNIGRNKVVPILVDVKNTEIHGPLLQFQFVKLNTSDMKRLIRLLNSELSDHSLTEDALESVFEKRWPELEDQTAKLLMAKRNFKTKAQPTDRELLQEILGLSRLIAQTQEDFLAKTVFEDATESSSGALSMESVKKRLENEGNFVGANLMHLNLSRMDFTDANFKGANLVGANLSGARLVNANFDAANLENAIIDGADLSGANFYRANLWQASMQNVKNLSKVKLMEEANFYNVKTAAANWKIIKKNKTVSLEDYLSFFDYYRKKGLSKDELRNIFLWISHSYPGEEFIG